MVERITKIRILFLLSDIMSNNHFSMSTSTFGVDNTFRNTLSCEVSKLIKKVKVLK